MSKSVIGGFQKITKNRSRSYLEEIELQEKQRSKKDNKRSRRNKPNNLFNNEDSLKVSHDYEEESAYDYEH